MGDELIMDSFPPAKGPVVRKRKMAQEGDDQEEEEKVKKGPPSYVRIILLLSLIPIMFYTPRVLTYAGEKVQKNQHFLMYLWGVSLSLCSSVFTSCDCKGVYHNIGCYILLL